MNIMSRMTGEELLLMRLLNGSSVLPAIDAELDRRARFGVTVGRVGNRRQERSRTMVSSAKQAA